MRHLGKAGSLMKSFLGVVVFVIFLVAIGLATRPFAQAMPSYYAVHAVLAAPFYAFAMTLSIRRHVPVWALFLAACIFGLFMGVMTPVMGVSVMLPAFFSLFAWAMVRHAAIDRVAVVCGAVFGGTCYLATVIAGAVFGSFVFGGGSDLLEAFALSVLGGAFGILGSLLASLIADALGRTANQTRSR